MFKDTIHEFNIYFGPYPSEEFTIRLGIWGGSDGFGNTPKETTQRIDTMVSPCRDNDSWLFKIDAVSNQFRPEKYDVFNQIMTECRKYSPSLVLLEHRLNLGSRMPHSTTFLLDGAITCINDHTTRSTATSHQWSGASCQLNQFTENHGVCMAQSHSMTIGKCLHYISAGHRPILNNN